MSSNCFLRLIDSVYEASVNPGEWGTFLENLSETLCGGISSIVVEDLREGVISIAATDRRLSVEATEQYVRDYAAEDDLRQLAQRRRGKLLTHTDLLTPKILSSATFNEFYVPRGLDKFLSYTWTDGADYSASLVVYHQNVSEFDSEEERMMRLLLPHLQRAVAIATQLGVSEANAEATNEVLDQLSAGVLIVDRTGRVLRMNREAETILIDSDGLLMRNGFIGAAQSSETGRMTRIVQQVCSGDLTDPPALHHAITRPSGKRPLLVMISPVRAPGVGAAAMLTITDPSRSRGDLRQQLSGLYGLSPSESDVAARLCEGATVSEIAEIRGTAVSTVRTIVKHVLRKTSTRSQSDLVRLSLSTPAAVFRPPDGG